ncbi:MAG: DedA family protein [Micrococcales bacterium]|nr:DedA family protein [Micrococcales bacterium]
MDLWAEGFEGSSRVYLVMFVFAVGDSLFPPIPSESLVIALAALAASTGHPHLVAILAVAAAGAFLGDQIAYQIGRFVDVRSMRLFAGPRRQAVLDWAENALRHRGAAFLLGARFVPIARVAVNMSAGALRYPRRRFMAIDLVSSIMWVSYSAVIGIVAGKTLGEEPLLAVAVGVAGGLILGLGVDQVIQRITALRRPSADGHEPADGDEQGVERLEVSSSRPDDEPGLARPPG